MSTTEHRTVSSLHFLGRYFFDLVANQPGVTKWVADAVAAFAIELIWIREIERPSDAVRCLNPHAAVEQHTHAVNGRIE